MSSIDEGTLNWRCVDKPKLFRAWYIADIMKLKIGFPYRRKWRGRVPVSGEAMLLGRLRWYGNVFFGDVASVLIVSPTSQSRLEKFNSVQLLIMSPMHRRHVPIDAGTSPSLTTIWKPGLSIIEGFWRNCLSLDHHAMLIAKALTNKIIPSLVSVNESVNAFSYNSS